MTDSVNPDTKPFVSEVLGVNSQDRVHVFIDAANMMGMLRSMGKKLDYKMFLAFLKEETRLVRASYFVVLREDMDKRATGVIDMIEYAGFEVIRKWGHEVQDQGGYFRFKGTVTPEMTVALLDAADAGIDHIVVLTGDGDFYAGVEGAKQRGARVTLLSLAGSTSDDLIRSCDSFVEFDKLPEELFFT